MSTTSRPTASPAALALAQPGGGTGHSLCSAVKNPVHHPNLMGIDRTRLTGVHGGVVKGILAWPGSR